MRQISSSSKRAFTLTELVVSVGVLAIIGIILFAALNSTLTLYVKNFSVNESHGRARKITERLVSAIHLSIEPPTLIDELGVPVIGNGPAAGISCLQYASKKPYYTSNAINMNTKTIQVNQIQADQPMPKAGDYVFIPQIKGALPKDGGSFYAQITLAEPSGSNNVKLTFANDVGTYFDPPPKGNSVINPNQPFYLFTNVAFIATKTNGVMGLRYYPTGAIGTTNFTTNPGLEPLPNKTSCQPFEYKDSSKRLLDINIRVTSKRYDKRAGSTFNFFDSSHTVVAYRSATQKILQPK